MNIRCHWCNDIFRYLDLKNSVVSLCCDLYNPNFHTRFNIKSVAEHAGNLKELVICNLYHPLGNFETVLNIPSLERLCINDAIGYVDSEDELSVIRSCPTLKTLSINFARFLTLVLKIKMPLMDLTHLNLTMTQPFHSLAGYMGHVFSLSISIDDPAMMKASVPASYFKFPKLESVEFISTIRFYEGKDEDQRFLKNVLEVILTVNKIKRVTISLYDFDLIFESCLEIFNYVENLTLVTIFSDEYKPQTESLDLLLEDSLPNLKQLTLQYFTQFNFEKFFWFINSPKDFFSRFPALESIE